MVEVHLEAGQGHGVVRVDPHLSRRDLPDLRTAIQKVLVDRGTALVDLSGTRCSDPLVVTVFPAALSNAGGWPWARLVVFGAEPDMAEMLRRTRVTDQVPLWPTQSAALAGAARRPPWVRQTVALPPGTTAPASARATVERACLAWQVPAAARQAAVLIASELVTNAVRHAGTGTRLCVERGPRSLSTSVRDFAAGSAAVRLPTAGPPYGGLHVVSTLARYWGVRDDPAGKTVWARLALDPGHG